MMNCDPGQVLRFEFEIVPKIVARLIVTRSTPLLVIDRLVALINYADNYRVAFFCISMIQCDRHQLDHQMSISNLMV